MLILVLGETGSGKTFFTEHKLFPYVGGKKVIVFNEALPMQLKNISLEDSEIAIVVEAMTDRDVPNELRQKADFIAFMTATSLEAYFSRVINDLIDVREKRIYAAMKTVCGVDYTPVVFDPNSKRFIAHYD